jgi:hypothetical protein
MRGRLGLRFWVNSYGAKDSFGLPSVDIVHPPISISCVWQGPENLKLSNEGAARVSGERCRPWYHDPSLSCLLESL